MSGFPWLYLVAWITSVAIIIWRYERNLKNLRSQLIDAKHRADFIEEELNSCRKKICAEPESAKSGEVNMVHAELVDVFERTITPDSRKDDLKIVEGIGPKIEKIFHEAGIYTFADLSATAVSDIKSILEKAGSRYAMHDPTTWPKQAQMAKEGKWDELKKWQSELDKGRLV